MSDWHLWVGVVNGATISSPFRGIGSLPSPQPAPMPTGWLDFAGLSLEPCNLEPATHVLLLIEDPGCFPEGSQSQCLLPPEGRPSHPFSLLFCRLPGQCQYLGLPVADYFKQWINLKKVPGFPCAGRGLGRVVGTGSIHSSLSLALFLFFLSQPPPPLALVGDLSTFWVWEVGWS